MYELNYEECGIGAIYVCISWTQDILFIAFKKRNIIKVLWGHVPPTPHTNGN